LKNLSLILSVFFVFAFAISAFPDKVDPGEFGVSYNCGFPVVVNLDGNFNEWPGNVPWHKVKSSMGWETPDNDDDGSFEFACSADEDFLYVAVKVWDDEKRANEDAGDDVYNDDSIELYIDGDNSKSAEYEGDCCQITIGRYNVGENPETPRLNAYKGGNDLGLAASETGTMVAAIETYYGYAMEVAVPLETFMIEIDEGVVIGFNIQLNDDDDGGTRDHKLSWSEKEREDVESAYTNPSVFGELMFRRDFLAVSHEGKFTTTWGSIKE